MSGPLDEAYTRQNITPGTMFELGCGNGVFTSKLAQDFPDMPITAVDLYDPETVQGFTFLKGDILSMDITDQFDNVCCVSSFEHCGIESLNYHKGHLPALNYHFLVATKLVSLIKEGGRLVITCPFGVDAVWLTDGKGFDFKLGESGEPAFGWRTTSLATLANIFEPLCLVKASAFRKFGPDHFKMGHWERIDPVEGHSEFSTALSANTGLLCAVFEKQGGN